MNICSMVIEYYMLVLNYIWDLGRPQNSVAHIELIALVDNDVTKYYLQNTVTTCTTCDY
jgi:hypothetical protein